MLYNSFQFLFEFLPACLALYFVSALLSARLANVVLSLMSFGFYTYWETAHPTPRSIVIGFGGVHIAVTYLLLLLGSIAFNYTLGAIVRRHRHYGLLALGVGLNLAALAYFKYADFFIANVNALTSWRWGLLGVALPLGISFFTFTQIAFLVDAYRGRAQELDFWRYCLFVSFFPHLIAGPIVHHSEIMPQFAQAGAKRWMPDNAHIGIALFCLGLAKKVVIADSVAPWANSVFDAAGVPGTLYAWIGALAYTMQLYFDFSGYCDMAIGLSMLFNVRLPDNFDAPYRSVSIIDFWRRWHMTLSRFLRDYLYIPLGGNRKGRRRRYVNLLATMVLGGIWHGAGWTFAIWGTYHGVLLAANHLWAERKWPLPLPLARAGTFLAVVIGWVVFRSSSVAAAGRMFKGMFTFARADAHYEPAAQIPLGLALGTLAGLVLMVNVAPTSKRWVETRCLNAPRAVVLGSVFFLCLLLMRSTYLTNTPSPFIYFQF